MIWYKYLYVGESITRRKSRIKWKINHNAGQLDIFVITLAGGPQNLLEIISAAVLLQKAYPREDLFIVGIAKEYDEARELALKIVMDVYEGTGSFDVRSYLLALHAADNKGKMTCP